MENFVRNVGMDDFERFKANIKVFLGLAVEVAKLVGNVLTEIVKALGIINPDENATDLGDKALQAEAQGIVPEKYDTYQEYLNAVQNFELDPEKSTGFSEIEKVTKGVELIALGANEKFGNIDILPLVLVMVTVFPPVMLTGPAMSTLGTLIAKNPALMSAVIGYLDGSLKNGKDLRVAQEAIVEVLRANNPNLKEEELRKQAAAYRK